MFRKISFLFLLSSLILIGCDNNSTASRFYDDGRSKPVVAISSVIDSTSYEVPWSLSDELTSLVKGNLTTYKKLYIGSTEDIDASLSNTDNPFSADVSWMLEKFEPNEFVVFLELIKHNNVEKTNATNLAMSMRIRIVDVRSKKPKVILQECINDNFYIAKNDCMTDYEKTTWGSEEYSVSRMGMAHKQLAKEISDRIHDYIVLSKSR